MNQPTYFPQSGNVRAKQAAAFLSVGLSTFWLWVQQGKIKRPFKLSPRVSTWRAEYIRDKL